MTDQPIFIFDCHLDLSMNAIEWNRDLKKSVYEIQDLERGLTDKLDRGLGTVGLPELRKGTIGLVVATQIARYVEAGSLIPGWNSPEIAWGISQAQLACRCPVSTWQSKTTMDSRLASASLGRFALRGRK